MFCDVCLGSYMLRFEQTKEHSHLLRYFKEEWSHLQFFCFRGRVTSNGFHLDLSLGAIHLTFPPDAVSEPTDIMIYRWKYGARLPQLKEHEAVVSDVIEISAATDVGGLTFNSEVKLVLSHSAVDLEGYERVVIRLADTEKNEWEEIAGCIDIRQVAGIDFYLVESMIMKGLHEKFCRISRNKLIS